MDANPQVTANSGNRVIYLDLLRIISAFAVVMLHVSAQHWGDTFFSTEWMIMNFYDSCVRWCVPVFVMISGALFLDTSRELNIKRLYTKNLMRILQVFILWSIIYTVVNIKLYPNVKSFIVSVVSGPFHFWFLKMLLGLYIAAPILKAIVSNKKTEICFICTAVITAFILPLFFIVVGWLNTEVRHLLENWYNTMNLKVALGYTGYFVLGHFFNTYTLDVKVKKSIYIGGCLGIICAIILTHFLSVYTGGASEMFYEYLSPFTAIEAMAIFLFVQQRSSEVSIKYHPYIIHFAKMSFGIYLVHILSKWLFSALGIDSLTFNPIFSIPCLSIIIFIVSYLITRILYNIPYLNKLVM